MPPGTRCTTREAIRDPTSTPADTAELMSAADSTPLVSWLMSSTVISRKALKQAKVVALESISRRWNLSVSSHFRVKAQMTYPSY